MYPQPKAINQQAFSSACFLLHYIVADPTETRALSRRACDVMFIKQLAEEDLHLKLSQSRSWQPQYCKPSAKY